MNRWEGPLLNEICYEGASSDQRVKVSFSHFMITFYRLHAYVTIDARKSKELRGDVSCFYFFFMSHDLSRKKIVISLEKSKKILTIDEKLDKYETLKRIKTHLIM